MATQAALPYNHSEVQRDSDVISHSDHDVNRLSSTPLPTDVHSALDNVTERCLCNLIGNDAHVTGNDANFESYSNSARSDNDVVVGSNPKMAVSDVTDRTDENVAAIETDDIRLPAVIEVENEDEVVAESADVSFSHVSDDDLSSARQAFSSLSINIDETGDR